MEFLSRYDRNKPLITEEGQRLLSGCTAAVAGLGGLGGEIAEQLARLGFGKLILIDCDVTDVTNLNRQLLATEDSIGVHKTETARQRLNSVNSGVKLSVRAERIDERNALDLLSGADIVLDALDNLPSRRILVGACRELGIPVVHGAIGGWYGQVSFILPGDDTLDRLYPTGDEVSGFAGAGAPAFLPPIVASVQTAQAVKWRLGLGGLLAGQVLYMDLLRHSFNIVTL